MTAKDKAFELVDNFDATLTYLESKTKVKQCAILAVDEIIAELDSERVFERIDFWNEVKAEIIKL
jgi:hypothetical protein